MGPMTKLSELGIRKYDLFEVNRMCHLVLFKGDEVALAAAQAKNSLESGPTYPIFSMMLNGSTQSSAICRIALVR